jgi:hypothetical protein
MRKGRLAANTVCNVASLLPNESVLSLLKCNLNLLLETSWPYKRSDRRIMLMTSHAFSVFYDFLMAIEVIWIEDFRMVEEASVQKGEKEKAETVSNLSCAIYEPVW